MSTTYGEREGELTLANAWEILGGLPCAGLSGYVEDLVNFELNEEYNLIIEKTAENLYRTISQKLRSLPSSNQAVKQNVLRTTQMILTPQESEQLSKYVSDDTYVKKQKEDIEELASMFKDMLGKKDSDAEELYIKDLKKYFQPEMDFSARYLFMIDGIKKPLFIGIKKEKLDIHYGQEEDIDVLAKVPMNIMQNIISGQMTFQRAFMMGQMTAKGNFKTLKMLDNLFRFSE